MACLELAKYQSLKIVFQIIFEDTAVGGLKSTPSLYTNIRAVKPRTGHYFEYYSNQSSDCKGKNRPSHRKKSKQAESHHTVSSNRSAVSAEQYLTSSSRPDHSSRHTGQSHDRHGPLTNGYSVVNTTHTECTSLHSNHGSSHSSHSSSHNSHNSSQNSHVLSHNSQHKNHPPPLTLDRNDNVLKLTCQNCCKEFFDEALLPGARAVTSRYRVNSHPYRSPKVHAESQTSLTRIVHNKQCQNQHTQTDSTDSVPAEQREAVAREAMDWELMESVGKLSLCQGKPPTGREKPELVARASMTGEEAQVFEAVAKGDIEQLVSSTQTSSERN